MYLSVIVTDAVVKSGMSVEWLVSDVLLLTVAETVVRPKLTFSSLVWDESPVVPFWFWVLELWPEVEDSGEVPILEFNSWFVREMSVAPPAGEVTEGVEETDTSDCLVLGSVTLRGGVESEGSSDVEACWCWVALGGPVKLWVPWDDPGLPVSEDTFKEWVICWFVVWLLSALVDGALWV